MRDYTRYGGSRLDGGTATWKEAVCEVCGKTYMRTSQHVYKKCCSWSCLRAGRRKEEADKRSYEDATERIRLEQLAQKCIKLKEENERLRNKLRELEVASALRRTDNYEEDKP